MNSAWGGSVLNSARRGLCKAQVGHGDLLKMSEEPPEKRHGPVRNLTVHHEKREKI